MTITLKELETRVLRRALFRYYYEDVTLEKAAEDEKVPVYFLIKVANEYRLPMIHTDRDESEGRRMIIAIMQKKGMKVPLVKLQLPA